MNRKAKKVVGVLLSLTLMLAMSVSVFASGSPAGNGTVTDGTTSDGKTVEMKKPTAAQVSGANENLGKAPAGMTIVDIVDVVGPEGYVEGTPITITFKVAGVKAGMEVGVLHQLKDGSWEYIKGTAGDGTITVTFEKGLSPVAFVVEGKAGTNPDPTTTKTSVKAGGSPKTGEFATTSVLAVIAVLAIGGAVVSYRKREEVR